MKTFFRYLELLKKYFIVILSCVFIGFVLYYSTSSMLIDLVEKSLKELAVQGSSGVTMELRNHLDILETIAKMDSIANPSVKIEKKLEQLKHYSGDNKLIRLNIVDRNGNVMSTNNEYFNISSREHFQKALNGISNISDPLSSLVDETPIVVFAVPVYHGDQVEYVLTATYLLEELCKVIEKISFFENGTAFLIDSNGTVIAHNDRNLVKTKFNIFEAAKADHELQQLADLGERMIKGETGAGKYSFMGIEKYMAYTSVKGTGWTIGVTAPEQEVLGGISRLLNIILVSCILFTITFIMVNIYFSYLKKSAKKHQITSQTAIDVANIAIIRLDYNGHIKESNEYASMKLGYSYDDSANQINIFDFLDARNADRLDKVMANLQNGIVDKDFELAIKASNGENVYFMFNINQHTEEETDDEIELMGIDLSERIKNEMMLQEKHDELTSVYEELAASEEELKQQLEEIIAHQMKLRQSEERYALIIEASSIGIWDFNAADNEMFFSKRWKEIMGYQQNEPINGLRNWMDKIHPIDRRMFEDKMEHYLNSKAPVFEAEYRVRNAEMGYKWIYSVCRALRDSEGKVLRVAGAISDITQKKMYEHKITKLAYFDSLTNLYNKTSVMDKFSEMVSDQYPQVALFYMDLDNFKLTNDSYGHAIGDQLLIMVAESLRGINNPTDIVARLGGDEFVILTRDFENKDSLSHMAETLVQRIDDIFKVNSYNINVSCSIGIAIYPEDAANFDELLKNADTAMYKAKEKGKNGFEFYHVSMNEAIHQKILMQSYMKKAISDKEFSLHYQPLFAAEDQKLVGFEALIRWTSPEMGTVSPGIFIPAAEETRLILPIGEWVLRTACEFMKRLNKMSGAGLTISINISILQLQQPNFAQMVLDIIEQNQLSPEHLELEITESVLIQYLHDVWDNITLLKQNGVRIALDDFGTGYSSLNYLTQLPINTLKIDRSFIERIGIVEDSKVIIGSIISISKKMGIITVAEGVETADQLNYLQEVECDIIQGFLLGKPQLEEQIIQLVENENMRK